MIKKVFIALAALIIGFVLIVALQPTDFRVSRSINIAAPAAAVFEQVIDFHKWDAWSPWAKRDPNMRQTYEGTPAGVGASYSWSGNNEVGEGRMTLTESRPNEMIRVELEFLKPFAATNTTEFQFPAQRQSNGSYLEHVRHQQFHGKGFGLFMNMDKLVGADFEKGLQQ